MIILPALAICSLMLAGARQEALRTWARLPAHLLNRNEVPLLQSRTCPQAAP